MTERLGRLPPRTHLTASSRVVGWKSRANNSICSRKTDAEWAISPNESIHCDGFGRTEWYIRIAPLGARKLSGSRSAPLPRITLFAQSLIEPLCREIYR